MSVTQLSIFIENKPGRLSAVTRLLGNAGINIRGFSIADTADYGILRLLVDHEDAARAALRDDGAFTVHESQVILAEVADRPGGFADALEVLAAVGINVEYTYITVRSLIAFGVDNRELAEARLRTAGIRTLTNADLQTM